MEGEQLWSAIVIVIYCLLKQEKKGSGEKRRTVTRNQSVDFFVQTISLESTEKVLAMGQNEYDFSFPLPDDARTSFHGPHGKFHFY